jgi:hypothetical protein
MKQWIANYVKGCAICQQNKIQTHKRKTPLYKITTTERALPFQQVAMDLITELPIHKGYNAILTIVDHGCSRAAIFLLLQLWTYHFLSHLLPSPSVPLYYVLYRSATFHTSPLLSRFHCYVFPSAAVFP